MRLRQPNVGRLHAAGQVDRGRRRRLPILLIRMDGLPYDVKLRPDPQRVLDRPFFRLHRVETDQDLPIHRVTHSVVALRVPEHAADAGVRAECADTSPTITTTCAGST